jgi:hypothetical protein
MITARLASEWPGSITPHVKHLLYSEYTEIFGVSISETENG